MRVRIATQTQIIQALCVLHKFSYQHKDADEADLVAVGPALTEPDSENVELNEHREVNADGLREELANAMWAEYQYNLRQVSSCE